MKNMTFESSLKELEQIVKKLEEDSITLEENIKLYQKGMELSKYCKDCLDKSVLKVKEINLSNSVDEKEKKIEK